MHFVSMVRYRRNYVPGGTWFFTVTLADRGADLLVRHIDLLRDAFREQKRTRPFLVVAIVVLPEHLHAVLTLPAGDADYPARWRGIKTRFTRSLAGNRLPLERTDQGEYGLWQRRYWEHTIRNRADLRRHIDYIHFNPVKHGLVRRPVDWPYSSFRHFVAAGLLPEDWASADEAVPGGGGEPR